MPKRSVAVVQNDQFWKRTQLMQTLPNMYNMVTTIRRHFFDFQLPMLVVIEIIGSLFLTGVKTPQSRLSGSGEMRRIPWLSIGGHHF
jgi:hypothetical protein